MFDRQIVQNFLDAIPGIAGKVSADFEDMKDLSAFNNIEMTLADYLYENNNILHVHCNSLSIVHKVMLSVISWKVVIGPGTTMPTPYNQHDAPRVIRLIYEIGLIHLGIIRGDWDKLMNERAREILELTGYTHDLLPLEDNESYNAILAAIGYRNPLISIGKNVRLNMYPAPDMNEIDGYAVNMADDYIAMVIGDDRVSQEQINVLHRQMSNLVKCNWNNLGYLNKGYRLYSTPRRWSPEASAALVHRMIELALPPERRRNILPWEECTDNYRKGMAMLVQETYAWLRADSYGPSNFAVQRSIRSLTGYEGYWVNPNDTLEKVITIGAAIFPPLLTEDLPPQH